MSWWEELCQKLNRHDLQFQVGNEIWSFSNVSPSGGTLTRQAVQFYKYEHKQNRHLFFRELGNGFRERIELRYLPTNRLFQGDIRKNCYPNDEVVWELEQVFQCSRIVEADSRLISTVFKKELSPELEPYFNGIKMSDLAQLSKDDLLEAADSKHLLKMRIFLPKITPYLNSSTDYEPDPFQKADIPPEIKSKNVFFGQPLIVSNLLVGFSIPGKKTIETYVTTCPVLSSLFGEINLRLCGLESTDMAFVKQLVEKLGTPNCNVILESNRILPNSDSNKILKELLQNHVINIIDNPLASVENKDFLKGLSVSQLQHLIWIPTRWLAAGAWKDILEDQEKIQQTIQTHLDFFKTE